MNALSFFLQITQLMFLTNKLNKNGNVFNSKNKNRSIQHCFCHIKFNNHQFDFATKTWRKAFAKSLLITIVSESKLVIVLIVLLTVVYSIVSKALEILSLTDFLNKWWNFRHLLLDLGVNSKEEIMICLKIEFKRKMWLYACWFLIFFVKTTLTAHTKFQSCFKILNHMSEKHNQFLKNI